MKNILITGGSGFIGRNLKESLNKTYHIFAPSHQELDLLNTELLEKFIDDNQIDVIIHGAIHVGMFNGYEDILLNDMIMFNNIEKVSRKVEKVLYFGSGAEYDKSYDISMITEDMIGNHIPKSDYGIAKYTMNLVARSSSNIYNLRLFGIFGKYELWDIKFISNIICKALFDLPITIRKECYFDYLYIEDLPEIIKWFISNTPKYHDYNVCMGVPFSLSDLVKIVLTAMDKPVKYTFLSEGIANEYTANNTRLKDEIVNLKITHMQEAIKDLISYYKDHLYEINYEKLQASR